VVKIHPGGAEHFFHPADRLLGKNRTPRSTQLDRICGTFRHLAEGCEKSFSKLVDGGLTALHATLQSNLITRDKEKPRRRLSSQIAPLSHIASGLFQAICAIPRR